MIYKGIYLQRSTANEKQVKKLEPAAALLLDVLEVNGKAQVVINGNTT